ncbi:hypothetical protein AB1Y20_012336 [Prymnesium parvum]|uniref:Hexosyltransferase n=1 Tax=Prymnesium parvum TaxID=97485 RepID=A0AB34IP72_PRYPA
MAVTSWPKSTFAMLLRGQTHRWGCEDWGLALQLESARSHVEHIAQPLEAAGHRVRAVLTLDRGCGNSSYLSLAEEYARAATHRRPVLAQLVPPSRHQAENVRAALDLYLQKGSPERDDYMILLRYDLTLLASITRWALHPARVHVASRCEPWAWRTYNCSNDLLFVVPRALLGAFNASVGVNLDAAKHAAQPKAWQHRAFRCCFHAQCIVHGSGHGCLNVLARHPAVGGVHSVGLLFRPPHTPAGLRVGDVLVHPAYRVASCRQLPADRKAAHRSRAVCAFLSNVSLVEAALGVRLARATVGGVCAARPAAAGCDAAALRSAALSAAETASWERAVSSCARRCRGCCRFVSVSLRARECRLLAHCDLSRVHDASDGYRSASVESVNEWARALTARVE